MVMTTLSQGNFFGEVVNSRRVSDFILNETVYVPGASVPRHSHQNAYFCLVRQGSYTEAYGERTRACGPSTFAYHPPGEVHSERFDRVEVRSFNIEIGGNWPARLRNCSFRLDEPSAFYGGSIADLASRVYREFHLMDSVSGLAIEGLVLEIVAAAARASHYTAPHYTAPHYTTGTNGPAWLFTVREVLHDRFKEKLALSEIADLADVHPVHMAAVFKRHYRCTIGQYVRRLRLEYACRELSSSNKPLADIAVAAGYTDQSHFSRALKQATGRSPGEYRRLRLN